MKILLIDNYDSFTYNLAHMLEELSVKLDVRRNRSIPKNITENYDGVLLSPGPGIPREAGGMMSFLEEYRGKISILGVCLGHQAICESLGGELENTAQVYHGISSEVKNLRDKEGILKGLGEYFQAGRYHSWIAERNSLPEELEVTAELEDGTIMAFQHKTDQTYGVQFHPESILTPKGKTILTNWINTIK